MFHRIESVRPIVLISAVLALCLGCHRKFKEPASILKMSDTSTANQLGPGFYGVESDSWRWTSRTFSVMLKPPQGTERAGATLVLKLFISGKEIEELGPMTLNANANGRRLEPETFSKAGPYTYSRDLSADVIATDIVPVKFSFDKALCPSETEARELAAVVTLVGLQAK